MFQLKENLEDIVNFISNSKDISKRDIDVLNKLAYCFSKISRTYTLPDACTVPNPLGFSLVVINLFVYMSYVFHIQPTDLIQLWIDNRILFLPGTASSRGIDLEKTTKRFMLKHRYNIEYVVADDIKNNTLKFISDKDEIEIILSPYTILLEESYVVKYANNKRHTVEKISSLIIYNNLKILHNNIKILHNTKKVIKGLLGITNKRYKELTDHFIQKANYSINPVAVKYDLYHLYAPIIKDLSNKYNIEVNEYLIIYIVLEKPNRLLGKDTKGLFKYKLEEVFEKIRNEAM